MQGRGESVKTTKGYVVVYLQKAYHPKTGIYQGWTGRLRVVAGDPFHDEYVKFNSDGSAFKHEYGDINLREK